MRERAQSGAAPVSCSSKGLRGPSVGHGGCLRLFSEDERQGKHEQEDRRVDGTRHHDHRGRCACRSLCLSSFRGNRAPRELT